MDPKIFLTIWSISQTSWFSKTKYEKLEDTINFYIQEWDFNVS